MNYIIDFIDWIIGLVESLWEFLTGLIENTIMLVTYLGVVAEICYSAIATMPSWLQAFGTLTIVVCILYMILGRNSGGTKE